MLNCDWSSRTNMFLPLSMKSGTIESITATQPRTTVLRWAIAQTSALV